MLALLLATAVSSASNPYATRAPMSSYLIADRASEIRLARTAAPPAVSSNATILVLTSHGYVKASTGTNGFTCLVERAWMSPFDSDEFWNWKNRSPICYNPQASSTVLVYTLRRTELVVRGLDKAAIGDEVRREVAAKALPAPEAGAMSYMMSREQYLNDEAHAWRPHLMFYAPASDASDGGAAWGADVAGSPVMFDSDHHDMPEPEAIVMVLVPRWSDGSPAPGM